MMLELNYLRISPWWANRIERAAGVEFYAWLTRRAIDFGHDADFNAKRMQLLHTMIREYQEQIAQLPGE